MSSPLTKTKAIIWVDKRSERPLLIYLDQLRSGEEVTAEEVSAHLESMVDTHDLACACAEMKYAEQIYRLLESGGDAK